MDLEKLLRPYTSVCDETSDSDGTSSQQSIYTKLEQLYTPHKAISELNTDSDSSTRKKHKGKRQPTRKPDPNVYNRNALQARENRRKKKAHLESLENKLQECERANSVLLRAFKRQLKATHRLEHEKLYYKNILTNRAEILELITALNGRLSDISTHDISFSKLSTKQDSLTSECLNLKFPYGFSDNESDKPFSLQETWHELLNEDQLSEAIVIPTAEPIGDELKSSGREHNGENRFFEQLNGICLHVASGKVSLEFCPSCHWKSSEILPSQVLDDPTSFERPKM